jgi:CBS domain-containing protein
MTKNPITVREDDPYNQAITIVASHGIRHLPVINEKGRLTGIFSLRSFLDEIIGIAR